MNRSVCFLCVALLAGCSDAPDDAAKETPVVRNAIADMDRLPPASQRVALIRAIRDAGVDCQYVVTAERIPSPARSGKWRAQCGDGQYHLVLIAPDGAATVVSRTTG